MKFAAITDPKGFHILEDLRLGYHLVLAQHVRNDSEYAEFYREAQYRGHFIIMDNGAAEGDTLSYFDISKAAEEINPDEIILPDVIGDAKATLEATLDSDMLAVVPPKQRAVVPQGNSLDEWFACANRMMNSLEFATLCVPKHAERFAGGRVAILNTINKLGWNTSHHVHLLGVWDSPFKEIAKLQKAAPWVRGIDTAAPFAFAQHKEEITSDHVGHIPHVWGKRFDKPLAYLNLLTLMRLAWRK